MVDNCIDALASFFQLVLRLHYLNDLLNIVNRFFEQTEGQMYPTEFQRLFNVRSFHLIYQKL